MPPDIMPASVEVGRAATRPGVGSGRDVSAKWREGCHEVEAPSAINQAIRQALEAQGYVVEDDALEYPDLAGENEFTCLASLVVALDPTGTPPVGLVVSVTDSGITLRGVALTDECELPTAVETGSWGRIKSLYR